MKRVLLITLIFSFIFIGCQGIDTPKDDDFVCNKSSDCPPDMVCLGYWQIYFLEYSTNKDDYERMPTVPHTPTGERLKYSDPGIFGNCVAKASLAAQNNKYPNVEICDNGIDDNGDDDADCNDTLCQYFASPGCESSKNNNTCGNGVMDYTEECDYAFLVRGGYNSGAVRILQRNDFYREVGTDGAVTSNSIFEWNSFPHTDAVNLTFMCMDEPNYSGVTAPVSCNPDCTLKFDGPQCLDNCSADSTMKYLISIGPDFSYSVDLKCSEPYSDGHTVYDTFDTTTNSSCPLGTTGANCEGDSLENYITNDGNMLVSYKDHGKDIDINFSKLVESLDPSN